jgi:hypothetical protein
VSARDTSPAAALERLHARRAERLVRLFGEPEPSAEMPMAPERTPEEAAAASLARMREAWAPGARTRHRDAPAGADGWLRERARPGWFL